PIPHRLLERGAGVLLDRLVDDLAEVLVLPVPAGEPGQGEPRRQQPPVGQVVDRGHQLLAGQVAGDPEDRQTAGTGDPRQPLVQRIPQRVLPLLSWRYHASPFSERRLCTALTSSTSPALRSVRCSRSTGRCRLLST